MGRMHSRHQAYPPRIPQSRVGPHNVQSVPILSSGPDVTSPSGQRFQLLSTPLSPSPSRLTRCRVRRFHQQSLSGNCPQPRHHPLLSWTLAVGPWLLLSSSSRGPCSTCSRRGPGHQKRGHVSQLRALCGSPCPGSKSRCCEAHTGLLAVRRTHQSQRTTGPLHVLLSPAASTGRVPPPALTPKV